MNDTNIIKINKKYVSDNGDASFSVTFYEIVVLFKKQNKLTKEFIFVEYKINMKV